MIGKSLPVIPQLESVCSTSLCRRPLRYPMKFNKLNSSMKEFGSSAVIKQSALAWKTINDISGRTSTNKSQLKVNSQGERLNIG